MKKAIFAEYGERIMKLQQSKNKVRKTQGVTKRKVVSGGGRSRVGGGNNQKTVDFSKSYSEIVQDLGAMLN